MVSKKSKFIAANLVNMLILLLVLFGYVIITIPARSYFHAFVALFSIPTALTLAFFNPLICFVMIFRTEAKKAFIVAFIISLCLLLFVKEAVYPWARYSVHFPTVRGVCWRENALFSVRDDLKYFCREKQLPIPSDYNWKQQLVDNGYDFEKRFETWEFAYDSSILINENIKGLDFEKLDPQTVLMFEGPKGYSFGDEETFNQFAKNNKYCYVVLVNGDSGRVRPAKGTAQCLFGGLDTRDMPLKWQPKARMSEESDLSDPSDESDKSNITEY